MFTYKAEKNEGDSVEAMLSAEWDTKRDAALAAKIRYNLPKENFDQLCLFDHTVYRGLDITLTDVK